MYITQHTFLCTTKKKEEHEEKKRFFQNERKTYITLLYNNIKHNIKKRRYVFPTKNVLFCASDQYFLIEWKI